MKISNLETAMKLAKITGRPLEDFYNGTDEGIKEVQGQNVENKTTEIRCSEKTESDIPEIQDDEVESIRGTSIRDGRNAKEDDGASRKTDVYTIKYGGRYSGNGKLIEHTQDMKKVEYNQITKKMTQKEVLNHPLLYVLFRAEEQKEGHFWSWLEQFSKE